MKQVLLIAAIGLSGCALFSSLETVEEKGDSFGGGNLNETRVFFDIVQAGVTYETQDRAYRPKEDYEPQLNYPVARHFCFASNSDNISVGISIKDKDGLRKAVVTPSNAIAGRIVSFPRPEESMANNGFTMSYNKDGRLLVQYNADIAFFAPGMTSLNIEVTDNARIVSNFEITLESRDPETGECRLAKERGVDPRGPLAD
ncbi:MAG: hypothetical protein AAFR11_00285 [Pseudomonadota bacterium]